MKFIGKHIANIIPVMYLLAGIVVWFATRAFYFEGDSAMHYLIARYAPQHPDLYFDHWGKPFFTLVASPFAQFGQSGMVLFNLFCMALSAWLTYRVAENLKVRYPLFVPVLFLFTPFVFITTLSGLTEPFSALMFSLALFFFSSNRHWQAALVLSFLPFCRSEGLVLISGFAFLFLWRRKWLPLVLLAAGTVVYSLAGWLVGKNVLWAFTEIPYANLNSRYGSGEWFDFAVGLQYVTGIPVYLLLILGLLFTILLLVRKRISLFSDELFSGLIPFLLFFAFHTVAWATGSFSSMGLKRVFVTALPSMVLLAARGMEWPITLIPKGKTAKIITALILAYVIVFPFTPNPAAFQYPCEFRCKPEHVIFKAVADSEWIKDKRICCTHPFMAVYANRDPFDTNSYMLLHEWRPEMAAKNDVLIWDNWFAVVESNIGLEGLQGNPDLLLRKEMQLEYCGRTGQVVLFTVR